MMNPKRTKKKICEKNTRISVFGAHDLEKKGHKKSHPYKRSRDTSSIALKKHTSPPPNPAAATKKRTINYFLRY